MKSPRLLGVDKLSLCVSGTQCHLHLPEKREQRETTGKSRDGWKEARGGGKRVKKKPEGTWT